MGARNNPGDIFKIDLSDGFHTYTRKLVDPLFAFYGIRTKDTLSVETIIQRPVLFEIWVMKYAISKSGWPKVGTVALKAIDEDSRSFFKQDPHNGSLSCYRDGRENPISFEEALQLERAAVWSPNHVEERLRDHFANAPNKWVELLRPKRVLL